MVTTGGRETSSSGLSVGLIHLSFRRVLVFLDCLEAEGGGDQLDLVEVEPLIHRHHQAQLLEGELDDLGGRDLHGGGELGDRHELVDPDQGLFPLPFLGQSAGLDLAERWLVGAATLASCRTLHALQGPQDVGVYRFLVHR